MFKLNLYPEYELKRREMRTRTILTAAAAVVLCVQLLVIGFQVLNTNQLAKQITTTGNELRGLQQFVERESQPHQEMAMAQELLELRSMRLIWTPKLAALSQTTDKSMYLLKLTGHTADKSGGSSLRISGISIKKDGQLEHVSEYLKDLRSNDLFGSDFAQITLGTMLGGDSGKFELNCRTAEDKR